MSSFRYRAARRGRRADDKRGAFPTRTRLSVSPCADRNLAQVFHNNAPEPCTRRFVIAESTEENYQEEAALLLLSAPETEGANKDIHEDITDVLLFEDSILGGVIILKPCKITENTGFFFRQINCLCFHSMIEQQRLRAFLKVCHAFLRLPVPFVRLQPTT